MKRHARVLHDAIKCSTVHVELEGVSACQRCANGRGCGSGLFDRASGKSTLSCYTNAAVKSDQQVLIEFDDPGSAWVWLVAGSYGLPLFGLLAASLSAWLLIQNSDPSTVNAQMLAASSDLPVAIAGLLGLTGGLIAWRLISATVIQKLRPGLCLQSARIVSNSSASE